MAMVGLREVLIYAENEKKVVTVTAGSTVVTGRLLRVNPLVIEQPGGAGVVVLDFDAVQSVSIQGATGEEVVEACKPQKQTKFMERREF